MSTAFEALARLTSLGVIAPTPPWMTRMSTSAVESDSTRERSASTEPWPSALRMRLSVFLPSVGIAMNVSSETRWTGVAAMRTSRRRVARFCGRFARHALVGDDHQRVAGGRNVGETHDLDRNRGSGFLDLFALVVDERADLTVRPADHDDVADAQRAVLHEHGRDGAAAAVERRFDDDAGRAALLVGLEFA